MIQSLSLIVLSKKFVLASTFVLSVFALTLDPMLFSAAAVIVIGAIAAAAVTVINALSKAKQEMVAMQASLLAKTDVIAGHVDGMSTAATAKRTADEDALTSLRQQLADSEKRAELLAATARPVADPLTPAILKKEPL